MLQAHRWLAVPLLGCSLLAQNPLKGLKSALSKALPPVSAPVGAPPEAVAMEGARPSGETCGPRTAIFAKSRIRSANPSDAATTFGGNDRIYARFVLPKPVKDYIREAGVLYPVVVVQLTATQPDQNPWSFESNHLLSEADLAQTFLDVELLPDPQTARILNDNSFSWVIAQCEPGPVHARLEARARDGAMEVLGCGDFVFDLTAARKAQLPADRQTIQRVAEENEAAARSLPKDFNDQGSFRDAQLSLANIRALIQRDLKDVAQILRIAIREGGGDDWTVQSEDGVPRFKMNFRPIFVAWKGRDGKSYYGRVDMRRNYQGGGVYGALFAEHGSIHRFNGKLN